MFVCPVCRNALEDGPSELTCSSCAKRYEKVDGIPVFALRRENHWGWIPREVVERVRRESAFRDWDDVVRDVVADSPELLPHIVRRSADEARASGQLLLSLTPQSRVLDIGCGLGAFAFSLARTCAEVVAIDLILEHLQWMRAYAASSGVKNLVLGCAGDSPSLPFADATFDAVMMSGVLEYVALACPGRPEAVQQAFLRDIARVLRPDGQIYIGIENRLSWRYFLGKPEEHTKMRFAALLPRRLADAAYRRTRGREFRVYTHSMGGYRNMLAEAGLRRTQFFHPLPKYSKIGSLLPLEENGRRSLLPTATARPRRWQQRLIGSGPAGRFAGSFLIVGQRSQPTQSLLAELLAAARARCTEPALASGGEWNLDRYEVRKRTGKVYLHLTACDRTRMLGKIPLDPMGQVRCRTSYDALDFLHGSSGASGATRAVAPRVFGCANVGGHEIFLEEWKPGVQVKHAGPLRGRLVSQALQLLIRLHRETQDRVTVDESACALHFGRHLDALLRWFAAEERPRYQDRIDALKAYCQGQVIGGRLPIVLRHGDFSPTNCLFDPRSIEPSVLVDWDQAEQRGLPLTDAMRILLHA